MRGGLILASASPRRAYLLKEAGYRFTVLPAPEAEPEWAPGEIPQHHARRAAEAKALWVARRHPGHWVLGADTVVAIDGEVLGKPGDAAEARSMLMRLSGKDHWVHTGVALARCEGESEARVVSEVVSTRVRFRDLAEGEVEAYVATGEPMDKAGAYGIQGLGGSLVAHYEGSYTNVVGLPMEAVETLLQRCIGHGTTKSPAGPTDPADPVSSPRGLVCTAEGNVADAKARDA